VTLYDLKCHLNFSDVHATGSAFEITIMIIIIIRNLYSAIMPLGGYRGAGGTGR